MRQHLLDTQRSVVKDGWEVLITTYQLAQGDERDRKFFRKIAWTVSESLEKYCYLHKALNARRRPAFSTRVMCLRTSNRNVISRS